jgi:hypothetical protein
MRGKKHSDEVQAQVMASLLAGQGVGEIAEQYSLPESTIREWRETLSSEQFAELRAKKGEKIEELLFKYLTANLDALEKQAVVVSEREYIIKQPADSLAVLHGVMADKSIRLLEAIERARNAGPKQIESASVASSPTADS